MCLDTWDGPSELFNEFCSAIQRRTHGRISQLSLEVIDGDLIVEARTESYYAVQLALAAIQTFVADFPILTPAKISFRVNGHPLVLDGPHAGGIRQAADSDDPFEGNDSMLSDRHDGQQSLLTSPAVATAAT